MHLWRWASVSFQKVIASSWVDEGEDPASWSDGVWKTALYGLVLVIKLQVDIFHAHA